MKKCLLVTAIVVSSFIPNIKANVVDSTSAVLAANNWYSLESIGSFFIASVTPIYYNGHISRYIVNYSNNGFVMTSACDAMNPILGFSTEHIFNTQNMSPELDFYLNSYDLTIDSLINNNSSNSFFSARWQNLLSMNPQSQSYNPGNYLIQTKWEQGGQYNGMVSASNTGAGCTSSMGFGSQCPVGCTALAMGQIMKYWNWPLSFDWCNMSEYLDISSPTAHKIAVQTLLANIGAVLPENYCDGGCQSSADVNPNSLDAFHSYGYSNAIYKDKWPGIFNVLHGGSWGDHIDDDINLNHPVLYTGQGNTAHAWIIDGYANNDNHNFHMNFGWGGLNNTDDGFYFLDDVNTSNGSFNSSQGAITGITPDNYFSCSGTIEVSASNPLTYIPTFAPQTFAAGTIYTGGTAPVLVKNGGGAVTFEACNSITLNPGFTAEAGSNFTAKIVDLDCGVINGHRMANPNTTKPIINKYYQLLIDSGQIKPNTNTICSLQILPNPAKDNCSVSFGFSCKTIQLYNIVGELVATYTVASDASSLNINLSNLSQGVYIIKANANDGTLKTEKLIKTQ